MGFYLPQFQFTQPYVSPNYWNKLTADDQNEFIRLRSIFHQNQKVSAKDRRSVTFRKELQTVLSYIERRPDGIEERCILAGICFAGVVVCVNTRQLKCFLGRCKSSINGSFQQMGYLALKTKTKSRTCITSLLPSLQTEQNILRQWTVRYVSADAMICFRSSKDHFPLPEINMIDIMDDKKTQNHMQSQINFVKPTIRAHNFCMSTDTMNQKPQPLFPTYKTRQIDFDLQTTTKVTFNLEQSIPKAMPDSLSYNCFTDHMDMWGDINTTEPSPLNRPVVKPIQRSQSSTISYSHDWDDLFADDFSFS